MKKTVACALAVLAGAGMLAVSGLAFAQAAADCPKKCDAEKVSRDANCPALTDYTEAVRTDCLQRSQKARSACVSRCAAPASKPAPAPSGK